MNKLRLSLDELSVESFRTHAGEEAPGTVNGHVLTFATNCNTCYCSSRVNACFCTEHNSCRCV
ncbi:MAG TPA: hypothetical protein VEX86_26915 [Longimicrobium sp.]|nr:hypothetical protein [Longimicrobium sp.]